jgi:hypothetical protein
MDQLPRGGVKMGSDKEMYISRDSLRGELYLKSIYACISI